MLFILRVLSASILILSALMGEAAAQPFPNKPVRLIVGYAAGSGVDIVGRLVANRLAERLPACHVPDLGVLIVERQEHGFSIMAEGQGN